MNFLQSFRVFAYALLATLALAAGGSGQASAEPDDAAAPATDPYSDQEVEEGAPAPDDEDFFTIPEGDAKEIQAFMHKLAEAEAPGETDAERTEGAKKILNTMSDAADRLLQAEPNLSQTREAYRFKLTAWQLLEQLGDESADAKLSATVAAARQDPRPEVASLGWQFAISRQGMRWREMSPEERTAFKQEVLAAIKDGEPTVMDVSIVRAVADGMENVDEQFVVELLDDAMPVLKASDDRKVKRLLKQANLEALQRRLSLMGNTMEISGELLDGSPVDWKSYRGKVVLVDFWATWCGPCRAEVPNVLEMYDAYHDRGFDVLGVSLDETPEDAHKYIDDMKIPWPSIFPKDEQSRGWEHPLAQYYGISGIPTAILVGKDGKVVSLSARGDELRRLLEELLGPPGKAQDGDG